MESIIYYAIFPLLSVLLTLIWKRGRLYFYSLKFPGPFTIPFITTSSTWVLRSLNKDLYDTLVELARSHPPIFKFWVAADLYIVNSQPGDIEVLLNRFCEKAPFYKFWDSFLRNTLFTAPVTVWKERRKEMNHSFNNRIISSFYDVFVKSAKNIVKTLATSCGEQQTDLMLDFFKSNLDAAIETLSGIDPSLFKERSTYIPLIIRGEKIIIKRFQKFWLHLDWTFNRTSFKKELDEIVKTAQTVGEKLHIIKEQKINVDELGTKRYVDRLLDLHSKGHFNTKTEVFQEQFISIIAASESTSIITTSAILILGLHPEVQEKLYEELSTSAQFDENISLEDINRMDYLDRVIKEILRLHPAGPATIRHIDKDIRLGSYFYPAGSNVMVPIYHLHRRPDLWPSPSKFDPDRFLPEEVAKRHRCAYMPFSFGVRNCIGHKYATLSIKVAVAHIVKHFKIKALNYSSFDDLKLELHILTNPKGYRVVFEKREV